MSPPGGIVHQRLCSLLMYIRKPLIFGLSGASWRKYWVESHCFLGEIVSFDIARVFIKQNFTMFLFFTFIFLDSPPHLIFIDHDQLRLIFEVLGTPRPEDLKSIN